MKAFALSLLFILSIVASVHATEWTVQSLPNPKNSPSWFYLSNPDGIVDEATANEINNVCQQIEQELNIQFGICVVNSIGSAQAKSFASELFNYWGIGNAERQDGLLLMVVLDQKRWEFESGYGMESILTDVELKSIGLNNIVPSFKQGNFGSGILLASYAVRNRLCVKLNKEIPKDSSSYSALAIYNDDELGLNDEQVQPTSNDPGNDYYFSFQFDYDYYKGNWSAFMDLFWYYGLIPILFFGAWGFFAYKNTQPKKGDKKNKQVSPPQLIWIVLAAILPSFFLAMYIIEPFVYSSTMEFLAIVMSYFSLSLLILDYRIRLNKAIRNENETNPYTVYSTLRTGHSGYITAMVIFFPWFFIPYYIWYRKKCTKLRRMSRPCEECHTEMKYEENVMNEVDDDKYLSKGQLKEEYLKSQDWDVWLCKSCHHTDVLGYKSFFTSYQTCPSCKFIAEQYKGSQTITPATYTSSGTGRKNYHCLNCGANRSVTYTIPMKTRSSSGSGSSYRSSGGSSYRSSGGSSWGGGRSGGGGAGGSW